jgi:hypothetical protein
MTPTSIHHCTIHPLDAGYDLIEDEPSTELIFGFTLGTRSMYIGK